MRAPVYRARPHDRVVVARRAHERFVQHPRGSECASLRFGFVQPPFRQLRGDENTNAAREFSETTTSMNDLVSACRTRLGPEGSGAGGEVTGVALSRTIARCPSRESAESFWTKRRCLASSFGVPAFLPVRSVSRTRHVPPDESVAPGARVRGGLGGAHAPHRKQVRARPRNVVLPTLVSEASRDASTLRLSPKESWHPSAPPNLRTRSDTRAPLFLRRRKSSAGEDRDPLQTCLGLVPGNSVAERTPAAPSAGFSASPASGDFGSWEKACLDAGAFLGRARWRRGGPK